MSRTNLKYCRIILVLAFLLVKSLSSFTADYSSAIFGNRTTLPRKSILSHILRNYFISTQTK